MPAEPISRAIAVQWATVLSPLATSAVGLITAWVLYRQIKLTREIDRSNKEQTFRLKQADVLQSLNARYEKLWEIRRRPQEDDDPLMFFMQYWCLQLDQFDAWISGLVANSSYRTWMLQRRADFISDWSFKGMSYTQGWSDCTNKIADTKEFRDLVEVMRSPTSDVDAELARVKPAYQRAA